MTKLVRRLLVTAFAVVACAAISVSSAVLPSAASVDVRAGFGAHAGFGPAATARSENAPEESDVTLMRPPVFVRDCVPDEPGAHCRYRLAPYSEAIRRLSVAGPAPLGRDHFAMVALLVAALGLALVLTGAFWRHLALAVAPEDEPYRRRPARRRR